jgi:hypothetical protein
MRVNAKSITFKRKEKDCFLVEVTMILEGRLMQIWEVSLDSKAYKLSHWTENVGEGLPILLPSESIFLNNNVCVARHEFRAASCPEYILDKNISNPLVKAPSVLKMHTLQYQSQSFLFIINSKEELQVYKKQYCSSGANR